MMLKLLVSGLVVVGAFFAGQSVSSAPQDEKEDAKKKAMEKMMADMQKCVEAAKPGEQHKQLAKLAGKWNQTSKFIMPIPDMPPVESTGTMEYKPIIDGRFVISELKSEMPGMDGKPEPFNGFQILGYNNVTKEYEAVWVDSMTTGLWASHGKADAAGKVITPDGTAKDPITPSGRPFRVVIKIENDDKHMMEWWDSMKDGKTLELLGNMTETRAK